MKNKSRILILTVIIATALSVTGCTDENSSAAEALSSRDGQESPAVLEGEPVIADDIPDAELTVPSYLKGEETEGFLIKEECGDSTTYQPTKQQRTEAVEQIAAQMRDSIDQVLADKEFYPNITGISVNQDCSEFDVTFNGPEITLYETTLRMSLCIIGDKFQLYQGKSKEELLTVVNYIDSSTGELISTGDSSSLD